MSSLKLEVDKKRREISSDNLSMSVGELLNLYKDKELDIHPEFQRVFRWDLQQKSRLIESLLLGIPLPSIYVATSAQGVWEVIDGVQRLSTIFEFMGELSGPVAEDSDALQPKPGLKLLATKHLPTLEEVTFEGMDHALRLEFKRTRLDVKVLARESPGSATGKFDLFERLNTYGAPLSPQELRNCILVSINPLFFRWLKSLASNEHFRASVLLSEAQLQEQYDMDLALRFIALREAKPSHIGDVHEFLRDRMEDIATSTTFDKAAEQERFEELFQYVDNKMNGNAFRSWSATRQSFRGGFSLGAYEGFAFALGRNWSRIRRVMDEFKLEEVVKDLWSTSAYTASFSGLRARERMVRVSPAAEEAVIKELERCEASEGAKLSVPVTRRSSTTAKPAVARKRSAAVK